MQRRKSTKSMQKVWGVVPFFLFAILFALVPMVGVIIASFQNGNGALTFQNFAGSLTNQYIRSFENTAELSLWSALIGVFFGTIAAVLLRVKSDATRRILESLSGVMANFAGLPLAFAFLVSFGVSGVYVKLLQNWFHIDLYHMGFNLISQVGLILVYSSFQIPLMYLLITPAVLGLRKDWEEAAATLGASKAKYWQKVGLPVLMPALLGGGTLLFANAFSAYVTPYALAGGTFNLVPIQIGFLITGNVSMDYGLGDALAVEEMLVLALALALNQWLMRRATKWR